MNSFLVGNAKSKTSWVSVLLITLGALQQYGVFEFIPDRWKGLALSIVGAVMLVLRNLTNESVTSKVKADEVSQDSGV